jgi:3-oxoacyl-[acyl-carrier-protein] synthase II
MNENALKRRVVVTGMGMVTPLGVGKKSFSENLFRGDSGIREIAGFDTSHLSSHLGAEVRDFVPMDFISIKTVRRMDRLSQLTVTAARLALEDASVIVNLDNRDRVGIIFGTAFGPTDIKAQCTRTLFTKGPSQISALLVPNSVLNAPAGHASLELGFRGINTTVNHQATSGESALVYAAMELQRGTADIVLAGGADILSEFFFESLIHFDAVSPHGNKENKAEGACPFDVSRNGPVAGEGCGIVCLELLEHALARGARPYCELTGWGMSSAPSKTTEWPLDGAGVILAMKKALRLAGKAESEIDVVQAAANGGKNPDAIEAEALQDIFGANGKGPIVSSVKGAIGESFSSGGIRACALALSIAEKKVPPTLGLKAPIAPLYFAAGNTRQMNIRNAVMNAVSYGGTNVSIIMSRI